VWSILTEDRRESAIHGAFNPETQLFASRGYANLQVKFRISGGYGKEFLRAGFKQIGRKVIGLMWKMVCVTLLHRVGNENKIAIYGGSHADMPPDGARENA
jgi:dipeptidyl aminopeptidase/acylaminoacyl peptidase